jgi:sugar O-acyltransferase (sialic acid O-acetyltransferase NeuD family)
MDVVIVGAGGHGRVVLDLLRLGGKHRVVGFLDADPALAGSVIDAVPVLGAVNLLPRLKQQRVRGVIVGIGDNRTRLRHAQLIEESGLELISALHPGAFVSPTATLGRNTVVAAGAVVSTHARVGDSVIINSSAVVEHECQVEAGAHLCPGALLGGRVRIGAGAMIGLGAKILPCLSVGEGAVVGAGAVVLADVPDQATAVGVPARLLARG